MTEMGQEGPAISVLMSVFNGARWLEEAVVSVLSQTFADFEFIIVDDGSTDESLNMLRRFKAMDSRITLISKSNTGLADSLNMGIRRARGNWIARLDCDDVCEPTRLEQQYEYARSIPNLVFVGAGLTEIDEVGDSIKVHRYPENHAALLKNLITSRRFPAHSSALYKTDAVRSLGGYRTRIKRAQDWDLWLCLSEIGQLAAISEPLVKVRKHSNQISHDESGRRQQIDSRVAIISYLLRQSGCVDPVFASEQEFESFRNWIAMRLSEEGLFAFYEYITQVKHHFVKRRLSADWLGKLGKLLIQNPRFIFWYVHNRLWGETITQKLADEWLRRSGACAA